MAPSQSPLSLQHRVPLLTNAPAAGGEQIPAAAFQNPCGQEWKW